MHHKKYEPPREKTGDEKECGRIEEVIEEVEELEITENENPENETHPGLG